MRKHVLDVKACSAPSRRVPENIMHIIRGFPAALLLSTVVAIPLERSLVSITHLSATSHD